MQIAYHLGAHCTDEDRLVRALLKNRGTLGASGIVVPSPSKYRQLLPKVAKSLRGAPAGSDTEQVILDAVMEEDEAERLVFSNDNLLCYPVNAISAQGFYATAPQRIAAYANLFPKAQSEFFFALRNPATMVPALIERVNEGTYETVMSDQSPIALRWAPVIRRILAAVPGIVLTVWCNEDTPLLWPEILRAVAGLGPDAVLDGDFDVLGMIMTDEGLGKLKAYLETHPPASLDQRRRATTAFLEKYARPEEIEVEVNLPGWTDELIAALSAAYDEDCAEIADLPGVDFIVP
ncbi:hypothetical protein [Defluviimonas sp. SAOS-178_SWC]|uniref:hypothetical protein n=1 Tax=Defluviimonas sp. SAOS-178_SWC TaxID=3121287 RepID=UPI003221F435